MIWSTTTPILQIRSSTQTIIYSFLDHGRNIFRSGRMPDTLRPLNFGSLDTVTFSSKTFISNIISPNKNILPLFITPKNLPNFIRFTKLSRRATYQPVEALSSPAPSSSSAIISSQQSSSFDNSVFSNSQRAQLWHACQAYRKYCPIFRHDEWDEIYDFLCQYCLQRFSILQSLTVREGKPTTRKWLQTGQLSLQESY